MLAKGVGFLEAGDAIMAFFEDIGDARLLAIESSAKKARRRLYKFALTKERGWALVKTPEKPKTQSLF